ncbi:fibronectin type III domain-containing protein [Krasilnikovia sp. MM14-A1259]|uniref:fibronectin type III domain-containing protein n=1 Tax=Krasilnikovia sp. MM14-A1259 TaxID=3373539 RepID=UPI0037F54B91
MPHRTATSAGLLAAATAGLITAALLPALPAAASDTWPVCADAAATQCIAEATLTPVGGQLAPLSQYGLSASAALTNDRLDWAVNGWAGKPGTVTGGRLTLKIRTGSWAAGFTTAVAGGLTVTPGGDGSTRTVTITGRATHVDWVGGDITGGADEMADPAASGTHFSGTTAAKNPNGVPTNSFGDGAYLTTDAQYGPSGMDYNDGGDSPFLHLQGMMRNPHLDADGRPVHGALTVWLPAAWFTARGTTAQQAADTGFDLVDTSRSQASLPVIATVREGGIELHADDLDYGMPYLLIYLRPSGAEGLSRPAAPQDVDAVGDHGTLTASWSEPDSDGGSLLTGYTARAFTEPTGGTVAGRCTVALAAPTDTPDGDTPGDDTTCTIGDLTDGRTYYLGVTASNALGEGDAQDERVAVTATPPSVPSAPTEVRVRAGRGALTATWQEPESDHGAPITGYTAYAYRSATGGEPVARCTADGSDDACELPRLANGVTYYVGVTATNDAGQGPANAVRVAGTPRTTPGTPRAVNVSSRGKKARVGWAAPANTGGAPVTGYRARVYGGRAGGSAVAQCTTKGGGRDCTVSGLKAGRTYWVSVAAQNGAGSSAETGRVKVVVRR